MRAGRVSVVIGSRNRRDLLLKTLGSVLAQTHDDLEILVVDEASDDGTADAVAALRDERVRVLRNDAPQGVARARNRGIDAATGELVAITDDDDLWAPTKLAKQLAAMARTGAAWSIVGALVIDPDGRALRYERVPSSADLARALLVLNVIPGGASGVVARTETVRRLGGFDGRFRHFADHDLYIRLALDGPVAAVDEPLLGYLQHRGASVVAPGKYEDLELIEAKHRAERERLGVAWNPVHVLHWIGRTALRAGDPAAARAAFAQAIPQPHNRLSRLRWLSTFVPGSLAAFDSVRRTRIPADAARDGLGWISAIRPPEPRA